MKAKLPPPPPGAPPSLASNVHIHNRRQHQQLNQYHQNHLVPIVSLSTTEEEEDDNTTVASATSTNTDNKEQNGGQQQQQQSEASTTVDRQRALLDDVILSKSSSSSSNSPSSSVDDQQKQQQKNDAMAYLLRYEIMVRQQEAEDMAVLAHMRPCVGRLLELMEATTETFQPLRDDMEFLTQEVSFVQLQHAVRRLEQLQAKSDHSNNANNQLRTPMEHLTTDRQLMMVLRLLTQKVDANDDDINKNTNEQPTTMTTPTITWAEIVQCYKVCIAGMLTLQHLPANTAARARARDRTLAMLSLFEPPSTKLFQEDIRFNNTKNNNKKTRQHNTHGHDQSMVDSEPLTMASSRFVPLPSTNPTATKGNSNRRKIWNTKRKTRRLLLEAVLIVLFSGLILYWYDSNHKHSIETGLVSWTQPPHSPRQQQQHRAAAPRPVASLPATHPTHESPSLAPVKNHRPAAPVTIAGGKRQWTTPKQQQQQQQQPPQTWQMDPFVGASDRLGSTVWNMLRFR